MGDHLLNGLFLAQVPAPAVKEKQKQYAIGGAIPASGPKFEAATRWTQEGLNSVEHVVHGTSNSCIDGINNNTNNDNNNDNNTNVTIL